MGDALTDVDVREVLSFHKEKGALATLALVRIEDTSGYGVAELDAEGNILRFQEKPEPEDAVSNRANTGIYVLEPRILQYIPENTFFDFANDVLPALLAAEERVVGYEGDFYWSDIGTLRSYKEAQRDALSGRVAVSRCPVWGGARESPERAEVFTTPYASDVTVRRYLWETASKYLTLSQKTFDIGEMLC